MRFIIYIFVLFIVVFLSCKKEPELPTTNNKIEIGLTTIDYISYFDAQVSSEIITIGGNEIIQMGHCWGLNHEPTIENSESVAGVLDSVTLISELTGLGDNTANFVRPFITSKLQTTYGQELIIETLSTRKPIVTTNEVTDITPHTATCGGTNDSGGLTISQRGICWNTTGIPTLENNVGQTSDSSIGNFVSQITGLKYGTIYYITAYATNEKGTGYGEVKQFSTVPITNPSVITTEITEITVSTASGGGNVTSSGNGIIMTRGVCWNTTGNPTLENNLSFTVDSSGTGTFTSQIVGLSDGITYFVAAYATNEKGTGYGEVVNFNTKIEFTDPRDGQTYGTVVIGSQTWMAENLNYETTNSWWYDNSSANGDVYGRLYTWEAATTACPDGWYLPSDEEWKSLEMHLGMSQSEADDTGWRGTDEGKKLKSISDWNSSGNGTDAAGFTALPGGYRYTGGYFYNLGTLGNWWSATASGSTYAWNRLLAYNDNGVHRDDLSKDSGYSVRCVRD